MIRAFTERLDLFDFILNLIGHCVCSVFRHSLGDDSPGFGYHPLVESADLFQRQAVQSVFEMLLELVLNLFDDVRRP